MFVLFQKKEDVVDGFFEYNLVFYGVFSSMVLAEKAKEILIENEGVVDELFIEEVELNSIIVKGIGINY